MGDYDIDCSMCNPGVSTDTAGTTTSTTAPRVSASDPGDRRQLAEAPGAEHADLHAGRQQLGAIKADRATLRGVLGIAIAVLGVVTLIMAAFQYMTYKAPKSIAEKIGDAIPRGCAAAAPPVPPAPPAPPVPPAPPARPP